MSTVLPARLDDLVFARLATTRRASAGADLVRATRAYAPSTFDDARWTAAIDESVARLRAARALDARDRAVGGARAAARRFHRKSPVTWKQLVERVVPGLALGIRPNDARGHRRLTRALRQDLVRRWLCGEEPTASFDLAVFGGAVREAAARSVDGTFGPRKVFIASVWSAVRDHPVARGMSLDDFKRQLLAAHRAGLVTLARADLAGAMNPDAIRESETAHLEARYHFVEREPIA
jgi:hypothetical protein